jgi:hypothetical protein
MNRLAVSFSGGETSALMTYFILNSDFRRKYDEIVVTFANTGQERDETLDFVHRCDVELGFNTVWIEAVVHHGQRKGNTSRIVTYDTAQRIKSSNRKGPFEQTIEKYGIPNRTFKHCTSKLKTLPMEHYLKHTLGWGSDYDTAIGIRSDEIDRLSVEAKKRRLIYPLVTDIPTTKKQVNSWWERQSFRLQLKGYEGNCAWCWKKTFRKHMALLTDDSTLYDFPERMEREHGMVGPEFKKRAIGNNPIEDDYVRTFFRERMSVQDLKEELKRTGPVEYPDEHIPTEIFDPRLDVNGGCEESCEVYGYDDDDDLEDVL